MAKRNEKSPDECEQSQPAGDDLKRMRKGDESLRVHPSRVDEHKTLGWVED